jgi:hypothetical protein
MFNEKNVTAHLQLVVALQKPREHMKSARVILCVFGVLLLREARQ